MTDRAMDSPAKGRFARGGGQARHGGAGRPRGLDRGRAGRLHAGRRGRLYIHDLFDDSDPGAVEIIPALEAGTAWMRAHCDVIVYTGDWHGLEDPEIDPVAPGSGPRHLPAALHGAVAGPGGARGGGSDRGDPAGATRWCWPTTRRMRRPRCVARLAVKRSGRPVFVQKTRFNVFEGNRACEAFACETFVRSAGRRGSRARGRALEFVVIGVARDVCVTQAVDGLQARGYAVIAVRDATWGLGLEPEAETLARGGRGRGGW